MHQIAVGTPPVVAAGGSARPLRGIGGQFFTDLFDETADTPAELAAHLAALRPGHSRIAVQTEAATAGSAARTALMSTIAAADAAGATVNLTWWHGPYFRDPKHPSDDTFLGGQFMHGFADVIEEARRRFRCVTHVTIQNEVNAHDIGRQGKVDASMHVYARLYRLLDAELKRRADPRNPARKLRAAVKLVGGDLVADGPDGIPGSSQDDWIRFMQGHMAGVLNGYSIHVYSDVGDFARFEHRLENLLPLRIGKPLFITEYGFRGPDHHDRNRIFEPGSLHGRNVEDSLETAFQHAWFDALAPHFGVVACVKWAAYRIDTGTAAPAGKRRPERDWGMLCGSGKRFAPTHTFAVTRLFNQLARRNWRASGLGRSGDGLVSTFAAASGARSAVVLNRGRAADDFRFADSSGARYFGVVWNADGNGKVERLPQPVAAVGGQITVSSVPPSGFVGLSTTRLVP